MREHLYRGKAKNGKWVIGNLVIGVPQKGSLSGRDYFIFPLEEQATYIVDPQTVGEYTDFKDQKGVQIFTADIVRDKNGKLFIIEWNHRRGGYVAKYVNLNDFEAFEEAFVFYHELEVVGNIHDNPELLEVQQ